MIGLSGSLHVVSFQSLVGFLAGLGKSGTLRVTLGRWTGAVVLDRGTLVAAELGPERGLTALDAIALGLPGADFAYDDAPSGEVIAAKGDVDLSPDDLRAYLDALLGPHGDCPESVLTLAAVPFVVRDEGEPPASSELVELTRGAIHTLVKVDGRRSVAEIAAGRGLATTIQDLQILMRHDLVAVPPAAAPVPAATIAPPTPPLPPLPSPRLVPPAPLLEPLLVAKSSITPVPVDRRNTGAPPRPAPQHDRVCSLLGFADDPANVFPRPTQMHRCFAGPQPQSISPADQRDLCLDPTQAHTACARFLANAAGPRAVPDTLRPRDPVPVGGTPGQPVAPALIA